MNQIHCIKTPAVLSSPISRLNVAFAVLSVAFLIFYVAQTNAIASQTWRTRHAQEQLTALQDSHNELISQQSVLGSRRQLLEFAQQAGMVPADSVVYLVQDRSVAVSAF